MTEPYRSWLPNCFASLAVSHDRLVEAAREASDFRRQMGPFGGVDPGRIRGS